MRCVVSCGRTSFPWLVFFFDDLLWGSMIHKHTGRWMWQGSASVLTLILKLREVLLSFQTGFNLINAAVVCAILESISRLEHFISYNWAQVLEACDCLKLLSIYFNHCVDATHFCLSPTWSSRHWSPCRRLWRLCQDAQLFFPVFLPPHVIGNAEIGECSATNADSAFMVF